MRVVVLPPETHDCGRSYVEERKSEIDREREGVVLARERKRKLGSEMERRASPSLEKMQREGEMIVRGEKMSEGEEG